MTFNQETKCELLVPPQPLTYPRRRYPNKIYVHALNIIKNSTYGFLNHPNGTNETKIQTLNSHDNLC
jgi:hypothetical protein